MSHTRESVSTDGHNKVAEDRVPIATLLFCYMMQSFDNIEIYRDATKINIPLRLLDDVKNDKLHRQLLALSICIKCKWQDSLMRNVSIKSIMELIHCGHSTAKMLLQEAKRSSIFIYNEKTNTLLARNFKKKYTRKVTTKYGTSFMMYRVQIDKKEYTLRSIQKEFKRLLFENTVNAKERRDEFRRNGKNNTIWSASNIALTQKYLVKKVGAKNRKAIYRLTKSLESEKLIRVDRTRPQIVSNCTSDDAMNHMVLDSSKHYWFDERCGLLIAFTTNEYHLESRDETERFGNVIFNHKKRQTKYYSKKNKVDAYYERYSH